MILQKGVAQVPALVLLTALVVLGHWTLLMGFPSRLSPEKPSPWRPFVVRNLAAKDAAHAVIAQIPIEVAAPSSIPVHVPRPTARRAALQLLPPTEPAVTVAAPLEPTAATVVALAATESPIPKSAPAALSHKHEPLAPAFAVPGSVRLVYDVAGAAKGFPYSAHSELLWEQDGQQYNAKLVVSVFLLGSRSQTSTGRIGAEGLAPTRFSDKARSEQAAHFERDKGIIVFSANTPSATLLAGAQDRLSVMLQLGALLAGAPTRYPPATSIALQVVSARDAEDWQFTVGETEVLKLPGGSVTGLKLTRIPRNTYDQKLELWLAPSMGYLPVRLRLSQENGDFVDQQWRSSIAP